MLPTRNNKLDITKFVCLELQKKTALIERVIGGMKVSSISLQVAFEQRAIEMWQ